MKKLDKPTIDPGDEVLEDVQQLARELWCVTDQIKDRTAERDESRQVIKMLKEKQTEIIAKIARCGRYVAPVAKVA